MEVGVVSVPKQMCVCMCVSSLPKSILGRGRFSLHWVFPEAASRWCRKKHSWHPLTVHKGIPGPFWPCDGLRKDREDFSVVGMFTFTLGLSHSRLLTEPRRWFMGGMWSSWHIEGKDPCILELKEDE